MPVPRTRAQTASEAYSRQTAERRAQDPARLRQHRATVLASVRFGIETAEQLFAAAG